MTWRVGLVGAGIAGRGPAKALSGCREATLVAVHRGRFAHDLGAPVVSAEEVLATSDVVIVAAPSEAHGAWVRRCLLAGCHVIVEYPLARTSTEARELFALAGQVGRGLHVEHIERLAPTTRWMAERCAGGADEVSLRFDAPGPPWADGSAHAWSQVSRLHRIVMAHGWPVSGTVEAADGGLLSVRMRTDRGVEVHLKTQRAEGLTRGLRWSATVDGHILQVRDRHAHLDDRPVDLPPTTLFADDLAAAIRRFDTGEAGYVDDEEIVGVLALAESMACIGALRPPVKAP